MGKRSVLENGSRPAHGERNAKRPRIEQEYERDSPQTNGMAEEVGSARQLQNALFFDQGAVSSLRSGLRLFKQFLDSILYSAQEHDLPRKRAILREYLETQKGRGKDERDKQLLPNLTQAWDYAAETNNEGLLSQITATLALTLKVFSSHADFNDYGTLLCKTILQPSTVRRFVRSLTAATTKESVISPGLRLLTEITRFNEGAHARAVYAKRDFTLEPKILGRNIALWRDSKEQTSFELQRKPSVRITAIRYLLTHLRYQDERAKIEILSNINVVRAVFDHLQVDPPFLIYEIFDVFKNHVFLDRTIPRQVKSRILTGRALSRIAGLYGYHVTEGSVAEGHKTPDELAHDFLRLVCTDPAYGVMLPVSGYYPSNNENDDGDALLEEDADLDVTASGESEGRIRNVILAEFIQNQRPYANTLHQKLVIEIFEACPELVSDYFTKREDFNYDPKLTSTWIGYSAFLYETIALPVPPLFGAKRTYRNYPPPVSSLLQNVLPKPLTQQVLLKCLNHNSDLVQLFAVRILILAFQKLQSVIRELQNGSVANSSKAWDQTSRRLLTEFCQRCPPIKTLFLALKKPGTEKDVKREATTRLLRLYYEVTPQVALQEKYDVSLPLCNALMEVEKATDSSESKAFRVMELEHWIQIARHSPAMRWWQKHKTLAHSPFIMLIKLLAAAPENEIYSGIRTLVDATLRDQDMLQTKSSPESLDALIASLVSSNGSSPSPHVLDFLDDACARFIKVPMKYFDDLDIMCAQESRSLSDAGPFSPLLMTLVEQWPFKGGKSETGNPAETIAQWLSKLLYLLKIIGEDEALLRQVRDSLVHSADTAYKDILKDAFLWKMGKERAKDALKLATGADFSSSERSTTSPALPEQPVEPVKTVPEIDLELPPEEDEKHTGLHKWRKKDIEEALDDGDVANLILCLCSKHGEIRLQAAVNIRQLMAQLGTDHSDLQWLYVHLGIVLESAVPFIDKAESLPYVGGTFATRSMSILADPTHFLFSKLNKLLSKAPTWNTYRLPRQLWRDIILSEPSEDGFYHKEVDWLLDYLIDGLRNQADLEIYRRNNIFEQLLSFYISKSSHVGSKDKALRLLLRAAAVGGSTTLVTRCGLVSWVQMMVDSNAMRHRTLKALVCRVWETCDREKVAGWGSGTMDQEVASIARIGA